MKLVRNFLVCVSIAAAAMPAAVLAAPNELLNVSYDPTRELYQEINGAFAKKAGSPVTIRQSHGGSGKQARAGHPRPRLRH
jgi:sulfate/thiosulfate transport system substrate-binding protein